MERAALLEEEESSGRQRVKVCTADCAENIEPVQQFEFANFETSERR